MSYTSAKHGRTFGLGYKVDVPDFRDWKASCTETGAPHLVRPITTAGAGNLSDALDFSDACEVYDQGGTESCVAHAGCSAAEAFAKLRGFDLVAEGLKLSRRAAYNWGRGGIPPFGDDGCFPRTAMGRWREWGFCADARWPWSEENINDPLPLDVIEAGGDARLLGYYRVDGFGADRCIQVKQLLNEGFPVIFGQSCYDDLLNYEPGTVLSDVPQGQRRGGHMTTITGYKNGKGFKILNSWGLGWGEAGFYWMSDARFGGETIQDVYAFTCSPTVVR